MTKKRILVLLTVVSMLLAASLVPAQTTGGGGDMGSDQKLYNPGTVEAVTGTVDSIEKIPSKSGVSYGIHLMVKTEKETIPVHLGPSWYLEKLGVKFDKGDKVTVRGSRVTVNNKPAIIAQEVEKGGTTIQFRKSNGKPLWSGGR